MGSKILDIKVIFWDNWGNLNMDWILEDMKQLLLIFYDTVVRKDNIFRKYMLTYLALKYTHTGKLILELNLGV